MTRLLAIDTSTEACSVALVAAGETLERYQVIPRLHAKSILPMVNSVLSEAGIKPGQLDAIAFTAGPGSFTGLRIAASVAQGIAFGADIGVLPVSTLATLALGAYRQSGSSLVAVLLDARMKEVYSACYQIDKGLPSAVTDESLSMPVDLAPLPGQSQNWLGVGSGWKLAAELPSSWQQVKRREQERLPQAIDALHLALIDWRQGKILAPEQALPVYMRDASAWKTVDQQGAKG